MMLGGEPLEHNRNKVGLAILVIGLVTLAWSWGNWAYRASRVESPVSGLVTDGASKSSVEAQAVVRSLPLVLAVGFALFLIFLLGAWAVIRASRRMRQSLEKKPRFTSNEDVWSMHSVRENDDDDDGPYSPTPVPRPRE